MDTPQGISNLLYLKLKLVSNRLHHRMVVQMVATDGGYRWWLQMVATDGGYR